jgi:uncharacterized cupin superfamily protein
MPTRIGRLSQTPTNSGLPASLSNPIRPERFAGRHTSPLAVPLGLTHFGVNHEVLESGAYSSLRHWHEQEDEFVFVLTGDLVLIDDAGEHPLAAGDYAAFPAGEANAHHLANHSPAPASFLSVGTRKVGRESIHYPDDFAEPQPVDRDAAGRRLPR